jgi:hypothetical protein
VRIDAAERGRASASLRMRVRFALLAGETADFISGVTPTPELESR